MLLAIGTYLFCAGKNTQPDDTMLMASVEAMARRESPSNTGPAEEKKCVGGKHRMVCRCIYDTPCTGTECY